VVGTALFPGERHRRNVPAEPA